MAIQVQVITEDLMLCEVQFHKCHKQMWAVELISISQLRCNIKNNET